MKKEKYIVLVGDEINTEKFNELDALGYELQSADENRAIFVLSSAINMDDRVYRSLQEDAIQSIENIGAPTGKDIDKAIDVGVKRLKSIKKSK